MKTMVKQYKHMHIFVHSQFEISVTFQFTKVWKF